MKDQPSLFDVPMTSAWAEFSPCRRYRYELGRKWGSGAIAVFIGLNPSTADEMQDDPTIRRCIGFAKSWGCGQLVMLNLFAFRATDPAVMKAEVDPIGEGNDAALRKWASEGKYLVAAWGVHGTHKGRDQEVLKIMPDLQCLGLSREGHPRHPLYMKADSPLRKLERP